METVKNPHKRLGNRENLLLELYTDACGKVEKRFFPPKLLTPRWKLWNNMCKRLWRKQQHLLFAGERILSQKVANFIEPFYINNSNGTFAAGHAGPNDYTECPENVIIARDERFAKSQWKHAGAPFAWYVFPEGEKTMLHMSEENGRMKMIATNVECMPTKHYLASYSHADFRHKTLSHTELFKRIAEKGATQHFAICPGDVTKELEALAKMMDVDYYYIGE